VLVANTSPSGLRVGRKLDAVIAARGVALIALLTLAQRATLTFWLTYPPTVLGLDGAAKQSVAQK